jgi:hypothetical protein
MLSHKIHTWYEHAITPNNAVSDCSVWDLVPPPMSPTRLTMGVIAARSAHSGGVNCLLMDGTVRFIGNGIDLAIWRALGTRGGQERLSSTEF